MSERDYDAPEPNAGPWEWLELLFWGVLVPLVVLGVAWIYFF